MKLACILTTFFILFSCNRLCDNKKESLDIKLLNKKKMQGVWCENLHVNALFFIEKDSIYFIENQNDPLFIKINSRSFSIDFNGYISKNEIIKISKDSLIYKTQEGNVVKLIKKKD